MDSRFAMIEAVPTLALIVRYRVRLAPDRMPEPFPTVTLRMREDLAARVAARAGGEVR